MAACLPASLYLHTHIYGKPAGRDVLGNNNLNNNNNVLKKRKNLQNGTSSTDSMLMISRRRSNTILGRLVYVPAIVYSEEKTLRYRRDTVSS